MSPQSLRYTSTNVASLQTDTHVFILVSSFILSFIFIYYLSTITIFSFALNLPNTYYPHFIYVSNFINTYLSKDVLAINFFLHSS